MLYPSIVQSVSGQSATVRIGMVDFIVENISREISAGDNIDVLSRPEAIHLAECTDSSKLTGTVLEKVFLGDRIDYMVNFIGKIIQISSFDPIHKQTFSTNQKVEIVLNPKQMKILKE